MQSRLDVSFFLKIGWFSGGFILCFFWIALIQCVCFQMSATQAFFYTTSAYNVQHMLYWLKVLLEILLFPEGRTLTYFFLSFLMMVAVCLIYYFVFVRRYEEGQNILLNNRSLHLFSLFTVFVVNVISQISQNLLHDSDVISVGLYGTLCCILLLVVQFRIFERSQVQQEKEITDQLLREAEKQQRMFKESLDVINIKCHDLKHQIAALKQIDSVQDRHAIIDEVEDAIVFFNAIAKTGNETLDVVLTEKSLQAEKHHIQLTYIADGSLLSFFTTADLAAFFGNILENAIEGVKDAPPDNRTIYFSVDKRAEYVWIHAENWCGAPLVFVDGFPVTKKKDRDRHGYGILSMRLIAEKYNAQLRMKQENEMFYVDALFPCWRE
jgi:uncharacterized membrane protein YjfL (UPF0719 family)